MLGLNTVIEGEHYHKLQITKTYAIKQAERRGLQKAKSHGKTAQEAIQCMFALTTSKVGTQDVETTVEASKSMLESLENQLEMEIEE